MISEYKDTCLLDSGDVVPAPTGWKFADCDQEAVTLFRGDFSKPSIDQLKESSEKLMSAVFGAEVDIRTLPIPIPAENRGGKWVVGGAFDILRSTPAGRDDAIKKVLCIAKAANGIVSLRTPGYDLQLKRDYDGCVNAPSQVMSPKRRRF